MCVKSLGSILTRSCIYNYTVNGKSVLLQHICISQHINLMVYTRCAIYMYSRVYCKIMKATNKLLIQFTIIIIYI